MFVYNLSNFVYNPSTQGAIESIDFSYSAIGFGSGGFLGDGLLLEQDGKLFAGAFTGLPYTNTWQTKSVSNVTAFPSLAFDGSIPDLSASGSPIRFGYFRTSTQSGGFFTTRNGIDNYSVTVNQVPIPVPVPEPSTILGLGVLGLGAFCNRQLSQGKKSK